MGSILNFNGHLHKATFHVGYARRYWCILRKRCIRIFPQAGKSAASPSSSNQRGQKPKNLAGVERTNLWIRLCRHGAQCPLCNVQIWSCLQIFQRPVAHKKTTSRARHPELFLCCSFSPATPKRQSNSKSPAILNFAALRFLHFDNPGSSAAHLTHTFSRVASLLPERSVGLGASTCPKRKLCRSSV